MNEINEKSELRKIRIQSIKRNFNLFKQSKIGILGLVIVFIFGFLALLQPFLFMTNIWDEATYHKSQADWGYLMTINQDLSQEE